MHFGLVMFEFPSNRNGAAYLNKRTSLETSNIGRAAGVCCLAVVCRVAGIGACEKEHPGRAKGTIKASGPSVTRHTSAKQQTPAARAMFEVSSNVRLFRYAVSIGGKFKHD